MELRTQSDNSVAVIDGLTCILLMAFYFVTVSLDVNLCHQNWYSGRKITASLTVRRRHVGRSGRPQDDSTEGQRTQSFPCTVRCETLRFRLQKYRNGGQL
jgi:hypothetical protein